MNEVILFLEDLSRQTKFCIYTGDATPTNLAIKVQKLLKDLHENNNQSSDSKD